jgi:hypothetical protein
MTSFHSFPFFLDLPLTTCQAPDAKRAIKDNAQRQKDKAVDEVCENKKINHL